MECSRVILGTVALEDEEFVSRVVRDFGDKIAVGVDCKVDIYVQKDGLRKVMYII